MNAPITLSPAEFIQMLRDGIGEPGKLVPPNSVLADAWVELSIKAELHAVEARLRGGTAPVVPDIEDLRLALAEAMDDAPDQAWDAAMLDIIEGGEWREQGQCHSPRHPAGNQTDARSGK